MSCSARLPVYALFVGIFFKERSIFSSIKLVCFRYYYGIFSQFTVLTKTVLKNDNAIFIVELPTYRVPPLKRCGVVLWEKAKGFVRKAGTFILAAQ